MKPSSLKSLLTNASHIGGARLFNVLGRAVYVVVLARLLGPEFYGLFAYSQAWYLSFLPATALGGLFLFSRDRKPDEDEVREILPLTLALRFSLTIVIAIICASAGLAIEDNPDVRILFVMFSVALIARATSQIMDQLFNYYEVSQFMLRQEVLFRSLELAVGISVLLAGGGLVEIGLVHTTAWCLQAARSVRIANRIEPLHVHFVWKKMLSILVHRGFAAGVGSALVVWMSQGPLILARHTAGLENHLGQIALAMQAFMIASIVPMSINAAVYPMLIRSIARDDGKDMTYLSGMFRATILFGTVAGLAGVVLGPWFIDALLGESFAVTGTLIGVALWLVIPNVIATSATPVLQVRGLYAAQLWRAALGVAAMAVSFSYLTGWLGPAGVIISAGVGLCVSALTQVLFLSRAGDIDLTHSILRPLLASSAAVAAYGGASYAAGPIWGLCAGLAALIAASWALNVFSAGERAAFLQRLKHLRAGTE